MNAVSLYFRLSVFSQGDIFLLFVAFTTAGGFCVSCCEAVHDGICMCQYTKESNLLSRTFRFASLDLDLDLDKYSASINKIITLVELRHYGLEKGFTAVEGLM